VLQRNYNNIYVSRSTRRSVRIHRRSLSSMAPPLQALRFPSLAVDRWTHSTRLVGTHDRARML